MKAPFSMKYEKAIESLADGAAFGYFNPEIPFAPCDSRLFIIQHSVLNAIIFLALDLLNHSMSIQKIHIRYMELNAKRIE